MRYSLRAASSLALLFALVCFAPATFAQQPTLDSMSLEQKVAQMFMVILYGSQMTEAGTAFLRQWQPGGVVLFSAEAGDPQAVTELTNAYQQTITDAGGLPMLIATDQEGGVVIRLTDGFTSFPAPVLITAAGSDYAYQAGQAVAQELKAVGVNMNLAPVADLETNVENPIIRRRAYGNEPNLTGQIVAQVVRGTEAMGVLATAKHFPGHGDSTTDSHVTLPEIDLSRERLESTEMVPFRDAVGASVAAVMVAHIWYPALEPQPQLPASLSHNIITGILRQEMGYNGIIMTDALDMGAIGGGFSPNDAAVLAVKAGVDIVTLGPGFGSQTSGDAIQAVVDAVRSGEIPEAQINASVQRILDAKRQYGILDWQPLDPTTAAQRVHAQAHAQLVDDLFRDGVTVAEDQNHVIPLASNEHISIVFPATRSQIRQECSQYDSTIHWVGVSDYPTDEEISWAKEAANQSDTTVVFTSNALDNARQQALVNALPAGKTVVVALWSPYDWLRFPNIAGYVLTYSPLRPAVPAACAILFGAAPARGQLAVNLSETLVAGSRGD